MLKNKTSSLIMLMIFGVVIFAPDLVYAQAGSFDSKVNSITNMIVGKILPAVAVFGLVYAAILAATGDESSKRRMVLVIVASIVGILAKFVIPMFQSAI